ncbi:peptidase M61 [Shewanella sp. NFH-SH190041]|uniref:M61 family metallopeptidase n=1 Tax=Shewanella sp. NFH-SH190041 TaxID=2950245 RepID=UPI0021C4AB23|nr:PDZ domain-containing protein [Shewanella sp. NFH-SH190041]BDM65216.1 peptidase M61 [Shewanella sp. NFH-SH190041]
MKPGLIAFFTITSLIALPAVAEVSYEIDLTEPEHQLAQVKINFPQAEGQLTVNLPVWRTGKYQVLPLADGVRMFNALDEDGKPLTWQRTASGEWQISLPEPTEVEVRYQIHGDLLGKRVRHIDASHAYLDASGVFMYSPRFRDEPVTVDLDVPRGWKSYSGMASSRRHRFVAPNYDVLVDSPIETGISQHRTFDANGREYELVVWGEGNYDLDQIEADLTALSGTAAALWDDYPFERYVYMVHATAGERGATEHLNSTVIQRPRFSFRERQDYLGFIATAAHEFIHTWNVKAYRPSGLVPYEYQGENMSQLLWLAEGSTSYFQYQLLLRAGIATPEEFFADLAKRIDRHLNNPGREQQSVAEASETAWISSGGDYAINHSVNIYSEGYLTSLALDFSLLEQTKLAHSYRDVHRALYRDHRLPAGYTVAQVQHILQQLSGQDYRPWWQHHVNSPLSLDFTALLQQAGLRFSYGEDDKVTASMGVMLADDSLTLAHVQRGGPAWQAGLHAGDQLVAINGLRLESARFDKRIADFQPGDKLDVTLFSNDKLKTLSLTLGETHSGKAQIRALAGASEQQKAFLTAWLGIDWPFDAKGAFIR